MSVATMDSASDSLPVDSEGGTTQCLEQFKGTLYKTQEARRSIVAALLAGLPLEDGLLDTLKKTLVELTDDRTTGKMRNISSTSANFAINIQDEISGLKKDIEFVSQLLEHKNEAVTVDNFLEAVDLSSILASYHPDGQQQFEEELDACTSFLSDFIETRGTSKPFFITDWDGTMKAYCSQYATNLQPVYSAVAMGRFASRFTRITAVLTAGPLRGPGILDLTALPLNGSVLFSGSWGREWWMRGRRVVHEDGLSDESFDAISRLSDEMNELLSSSDYSQFSLVGSGFQRKVDRLTLGVQTVFGHIPTELTGRYLDAVKERIHRIDPNQQVLKLDDHNPLEIEICAHSRCAEGGPLKVWDKANGVAALVDSLGDSIKEGTVLVAGDTTSDLPMLKHVMSQNPEGAMALFVGATDSLRQKVRDLLKDEKRVCFISSPDVAHAAFARIIASRNEVD